MRKLLVFIFLLFEVNSYSKTIYVATNGNNGNAGTIAAPYLTIQYGLNQLRAGDTLFIRGGTYNITSYLSIDGTYDGTIENPICVFAYPSETVIVDADGITQSSATWFRNIAYWYFKDLTIRNAKQDGSLNDVRGWNLQNCNYVYMINCTAYGNGGPGFATCDNGAGAGGRYYFTNCDSYSNYDSDSDNPGNDADGWTIIGQYSNPDTATWPKIYLNSCRAWGNSDDGYDQTYGAYIRFNNCWSINNGFAGDGNGIKGGLYPPASAPTGMMKLTNNLSVYNKQGFRINSNSGTYFPHIKFYNNTAAYNTSYNFDGSYHPPQTGGSAIFKNNLAYGQSLQIGWATPGNFNMEPAMSYTSEYNTWNVAMGFTSGGNTTLADADFVSVDSTGLTSARQSDGSLPNLDFLKLVAGSDLVDAGTDVGLPYYGSAPDLGAFETITGAPAEKPVYLSSTVDGPSPSIIKMNYNSTLANIVPAVSSFSVMVNSVARTVSSVSISGTRVSLTLSSPVVYGNVVTVAYTKPATNPLQTSTGSQAASITARPVTNNVAATAIPVYVSSAIANTTPSIIEVTYNTTLANIVPTASAFSVMVNSVAKTVSSVSISGTRVSLTLSSPVVYGNVVMVAYTKPATNPLQTATGGQAASITARPVTNNVAATAIPVYVSSAIANTTPSIIEVTYNITLANIVPTASAFSVMVNSGARTVSSVSISGTRVSLTLSNPVVYGNIVTVAYTKPATNPLQTASGVQVATFSPRSVLNNCTQSSNQSPNVSIFSPSNNSSFKAPGKIEITVDVSDIDGTIAKVEFFNGSIKLGERTTAPYSFTWAYVPRGSYSITAVATDNLNSKVISSPVTVSVRSRLRYTKGAPVISFIEPANGEHFVASEKIDVSIDSYDPDTLINKIEYLIGDTRIGESHQAPYSISFDSPTSGSYRITSNAYDELNEIVYSSSVDVYIDAATGLINLYPNPNDGHFSIESLIPLQSRGDIVNIVNSTGQTVYQGTWENEENTRQFDLSHLDPGIYILIIKNQGILTTKKFIKN